jgi:hypothetical protein
MSLAVIFLCRFIAEYIALLVHGIQGGCGLGNAAP